MVKSSGFMFDGADELAGRRSCGYSSGMSKANLLSSAEPTGAERQLLDEALEEFTRDRDPGKPWREVLEDIFASAPGRRKLRPLNPKHHLTPALSPIFMAERGTLYGASKLSNVADLIPHLVYSNKS